MKRYLCLMLALIITLMGCASEEQAQEAIDDTDLDPAPIEDIVEDEDIPLTEVLGGRLYVRLPEEMDSYDQKDDVNIDATSFSFQEIEWLYPFGIPNLYFVEMYTLSTGDIREDAELFNQKSLLYYNYESVFSENVIQHDNGLEILVGEPTETAVRYHDTLQRLALIKLPDDTLVALLMSTSDDMANRQQELDVFFDDVLASLTPGDKTLDLQSHPVSVYGTGVTYETLCPDGYVMTRNWREWTECYSYTKVNKIDQKETSILIYTRYVGPIDKFEEPEGPYEFIDGNLFGCDIEWKIFTLDDGSYHACTYIDFDTEHGEENYYIEAQFSDDSDWDTMRTIFETISLPGK